MTTFAGWLAEQRKRDDAVGWFARYWRDLPETPRLSSPSSIASHLEDRTTKPGQAKDGSRLPYGFTDPDGGNYVRDAYDATLHEYRAVRAQIVQSTADEAGIQPPLADAQQAAEPSAGGLAGQAVARATDAAVRAAQQHAVVSSGVIPAPQITLNTAGINSTEIPQLRRIELMLERICEAVGIPLPGDELSWADWYEQAAVFAMARGPEWETAEA